MTVSIDSLRRTAPSSALKVRSATTFLPKAEHNTRRRKGGIIYTFLTHVHGVRKIDLEEIF